MFTLSWFQRTKRTLLAISNTQWNLILHFFILINAIITDWSGKNSWKQKVAFRFLRVLRFNWWAQCEENLCSKCRSSKRKLCTQNREISSDWSGRGKARECPGNLAVGKSPFPWERKGAWEFNDTCDLPTVLMTLSQGHKIGEAARVKSSPRYASSHSCGNSLRTTFISFYLRCSIKKHFYFISRSFSKKKIFLSDFSIFLIHKRTCLRYFIRALAFFGCIWLLVLPLSVQ